ncbi:hypothetical protein M3Y97_00327700 [Aphelenchoides bicaudatus]|nr:hypothetical protein M3Y97_00327700 [Aphelenchoides bicaudatus]
MSTTPTTETAEATSQPAESTTSSSANNNGQNNSAVRKGRGSQVFTQEMACALVEMYYARKKDFPGSGYSLPPEGFEAIASELRTKFNVTPNEIDQQTLKKKLSNIRTRVRNRCRDMRPDADISGLNLTPSEKIYFRYFGSPGGSETQAGESGSSTPLPNGVNDNNQSTQQEQNGHSPAVAENNKTELPLTELVSLSIIQKYAENLHLFAQSASNIKNIEQQRFAVFDGISKSLLESYNFNLSVAQVRSRVDEIGRSLAQKMDDFRRLSGVNNENIVLRPTNMTPAESELFDAQFTESPPDPRKNFGGVVTSGSASQVILPPPSSVVEAQKTTDGQPPIVQLTDGFYSVILPSSSNGMPALPEGSSAPTSSMLISPPSSEPIPLPSATAPTSNPPLPGASAGLTNTESAQASTSAAGSGDATTSQVQTTARRPTARKNNKRKGSPGPGITDAEMDRRFQETIDAVLSPPNKKTKVSVDEKRQALMAVEKQRTLRVQRQLAEEQLQLVRKQTQLADDQIQFYKIWTEIGNRIRGFLRP